ncbi:MAG: Rrf2 family transcriptional regulator [Bacteroidetes bacterium]|nr:Rrf2 family transcriptional regulator [Bacteroidota bacterium]MCW5895752.1 Rrf2 family transcriptional regulator [Bacteroidota bacterium]
MSILFSRQCEYAIQGVLYLALKPEGEMTSIKELTKRLDIPYHFLGKILQRLAGTGLLTSLKGPTGGFALGRKAKDITLFDVVNAIDGADFTKNCVMGFPECSGKNPCSVHETWGRMRDEIYDMLVRKNIAEMAKDMKKTEYRSARS